MTIQDPFRPCYPLDLRGGFITPSSFILQCQRQWWEPPLTRRPPSLHLFQILSSYPSSLIFTFIFRIFLPFAFCKMRDVGYWLLGNKPGYEGDSVVSLTTRLGQPQMKKLVSAVGGKGAFLGSAKSVCRGVGVGLGASEGCS